MKIEQLATVELSLAEKLNVSVAAVTQWENGSKNPTPEPIHQIVLIFKKGRTVRMSRSIWEKIVKSNHEPHAIAARFGRITGQ